MKTARNYLYHSGSDKKRYMWNNGKEIVWSHILHVYHQQENQGLKLLVRLKEVHVSLKSYSTLATQALSDTVATAGVVG